MANLAHQALLVLIALAMIHNNEATAPFFLQAITSALGTIPFTAGPMTTGLVGAKLAVGSKLLYYLGFFGRRRSKSKPVKVVPVRSKQTVGGGGAAHFAGGMQALPLPYAFGAGGFPPQQFSAGGFGASGFGGGSPNFYNQFPYGFDPAQLFQMMASQGIDPATAMQAMSSFQAGAGAQGTQFPQPQFSGSQPVAASQFPFPPGGVPSSASGNTHVIPSENPSKKPNTDASSDGSDNDVESFFTFLRDMDENTCISRLMCDIGKDPSFLGDFSENIHGIVSSLDVLPSSGAFQYIAIMKSGRSEGGCDHKFPQCSDAAYEIVKNVAPSVGMPQNINSESVNQL